LAGQVANGGFVVCCEILKVGIIGFSGRRNWMRPSEALQLHRADIRRVVEMNGARNPRVFGSAIHGDDTGESDLDLLVDPIDGRTTLTSLVRIKREVEALTGVRTDVLTPMALHERFRQAVLAEAAPV
jgi:predicted nucleotidyltransferase